MKRSKTKTGEGGKDEKVASRFFNLTFPSRLAEQRQLLLLHYYNYLHHHCVRLFASPSLCRLPFPCNETRVVVTLVALVGRGRREKKRSSKSCKTDNHRRFSPSPVGGMHRDRPTHRPELSRAKKGEERKKGGNDPRTAEKDAGEGNGHARSLPV